MLTGYSDIPIPVFSSDVLCSKAFAIPCEAFSKKDHVRIVAVLITNPTKPHTSQHPATLPGAISSAGMCIYLSIT